MKGDDYSYETLKKMSYINCVEKEVTRVFGPVNEVFFRSVIQDHHIKGVPIGKQTYLTNSSLGTHYTEKYFKNAA